MKPLKTLQIVSFRLSSPLRVLFTLLLSFLMGLGAVGCDPRGMASGPSSPSSSSSSSDLSEEPSQGVANLEDLEYTLSLRRDEGVSLPAGQVSFTLFYVRRPNQAAPRAAELMIDHPEGLTFERAEPLSAVQLASKQLIAQPSEEQVRVIIMSPGNLNTLESGPLARLIFQGTSSTGAPSIRARLPYFAPLSANEGVTLAPATSTAPASGESRE